MKQHTALVEARVKSLPAFASKTWVSLVPRDASGNPIPTPPYVVLHPSDGTDTSERVTGPRAWQHPRFTLHVVGSSYASLGLAVEALKARFIVSGVPLPIIIAGERARNFFWSSPVPIQVDNDITPPLLYQVIELGWTAEPI